jgi:endonuclease I
MNSIKLPNYVERRKIFDFLFKNPEVPLFCVFTGYIGDQKNIITTDLGFDRYLGMNEEHIIPKLLYRNSHPEFAYDLHITAPSIQFLNSARGNLRFG